MINSPWYPQLYPILSIYTGLYSVITIGLTGLWLIPEFELLLWFPLKVLFVLSVFLLAFAKNNKI